jgi:hypothetical protein
VTRRMQQDGPARLQRDLIFDFPRGNQLRAGGAPLAVPHAGLAGVPLCLLSLSARPHMPLNRCRLSLLKLPSGRVLNRTRPDGLAPAGSPGLGGRRRGFLVGCGDARRGFLALLHFRQPRRGAREGDSSRWPRSVSSMRSSVTRMMWIAPRASRRTTLSPFRSVTCTPNSGATRIVGDGRAVRLNSLMVASHRARGSLQSATIAGRPRDLDPGRGRRRMAG